MLLVLKRHNELGFNTVNRRDDNSQNIGVLVQIVRLHFFIFMVFKIL